MSILSIFIAILCLQQRQCCILGIVFFISPGVSRSVKTGDLVCWTWSSCGPFRPAGSPADTRAGCKLTPVARGTG